MKFSLGCLVGVLLGIALAILAYAGYTFFNPAYKMPLAPVSSLGDPDLTVTIKEQYLNEQLRKGLEARGMNAGDLTIDLHAPNRAVAAMSFGVKVLGQSFRVRPLASFHFGVANGTVTFELDNVDVAGFTVPQDIVNQQIGDLQRYADDQLNGELKRVLANTGLHVVGVESTESALIVRLSH
jgi:hypothetical protein